MEWTRERTLEFIEEYRKRTILWNTLSDDYRDSGAKLDAHRELATKFEVDVETAKKKIKNLRTAFRREYKKLHKQNAGKRRSYWYGYEPLSFLEHVVIEKLGYSSGVFADLDLSDEEQSGDYNDDPENPLNTSDVPSNSATKQKRKIEEIDEDRFEENFTILDNSRGHILYEEPTYEQQNEGTSNTRYKRKKDHANEEKILDRNVNRDDLSVYGEHVSNEIRKLDKRSQIVTKHMINNILFEAAMGKYSKADLNTQFNLSESISYPDMSNSTFQFMTADEDGVEEHSE